MASIWGEYVSELGQKFSDNIDNQGQFYWEDVANDFATYVNRGAIILTTILTDTYPIFRETLAYLQSGYKLSHSSLLITINVGTEDNYMLEVNVTINGKAFENVRLNIPDSIVAYRSNAAEFFEHVMNIVSHIPFIDITNSYVHIRNSIIKLNTYLPSDMNLDNTDDIMTFLNISLATSYTIDKL